MKYFIFLLLAGCGQGSFTNYRIKTPGSLPTICKVAKLDKCGMTLEKCDNGMVYLCAHNVEMGVH